MLLGSVSNSCAMGIGAKSPWKEGNGGRSVSESAVKVGEAVIWIFDSAYLLLPDQGWTPGVSWGACMLLLLPLLLLLRWCCRLPKRTPRHTETPCYWRTERPPKNMLPRGLTSLLDSDKNKASSAAVPAAGPAAAAAAAALVLQASKRTPRHTETPCYWRTERPPKNMLPRGLTSLLDSDKNKASSAPGLLLLLWWWSWCCYCCWSWCCRPPGWENTMAETHRKRWV